MDKTLLLNICEELYFECIIHWVLLLW